MWEGDTTGIAWRLITGPQMVLPWADSIDYYNLASKFLLRTIFHHYLALHLLKEYHPMRYQTSVPSFSSPSYTRQLRHGSAKQTQVHMMQLFSSHYYAVNLGFHLGGPWFLVVFSNCGAVTAVCLTRGHIQALKSQQPGNLSESTMVRISK